MTIERGGISYVITDDRTISEYVPEYCQTVRHMITVRGDVFSHTAKGATRAHCFRGLLDQGFSVMRAPGETIDGVDG